MKKGILTSLGLAAVLTLGLASVNEYRDFKEVDASEGTWTLVTDASTLAVGDKVVIAAKDSNVALSTEQKSNNRGQVDITKSGNTMNFTTAVQELTLQAGTSSGSFAFYTGSGYLYAASTTNNHLKTHTSLDDKGSFNITVSSSGVATVKSVGNTSRGWMRHNASSSLFACYGSGQADICLYEFIESTEPSAPDQPVDKTSEVIALFEDYYNYGTYTKETILNVNTDTMEEIKEYFHAGAKAKYRKTEYTPETLTMYTSDDGEYDTDLYSKYENAEENGTKYVKHSGTVGGNYNYYEKETIDDWFVTLPDFKIITTGWTDEDGDGVYTFELEEQPEITTMAREFVAPMWLATDVAKNYIIFDKLTVEKDGSDLVMKLYTVEGNSGNLEDQNNLVFAQATISYVPKVFTTIAEAKTAKEGAKVELTNVTVTKIYEDWSSYNNMSFYVSDGINEILVFRTPNRVYLNDTVSVSGCITIYSGTGLAQVAQGATVKVTTPHDCSYGEATCTTPASCNYCGAHKDDILASHSYANGVCTVCGEVDPDYEGDVVLPVDETLIVKANAGTLASDSLSISWTSPNFTILNEKNESNTAIRTSDSDHFRVYQGNKTTISGSNITKVVITVTESKYASVLAGSLTTTGVTAAYSGTTVTFTVDSGTIDSLVITATSQWRLSSMTVWYIAD